jgi:hypothetical protein
VAQPVGIGHKYISLELSPIYSGNRYLFVANLPWVHLLRSFVLRWLRYNIFWHDRCWRWTTVSRYPAVSHSHHIPYRKNYRKTLNEGSLPLLVTSTSLPHFLRLGNAFTVQAKCSYCTYSWSCQPFRFSPDNNTTTTLTTADYDWSHFLISNLNRNASEADHRSLDVAMIKSPSKFSLYLSPCSWSSNPLLRRRWLCPANHIHQSVLHIVLDLLAHTADDLSCQFTAATLHLPRVFHVCDLRSESVQVSMKPFRWLLSAAEDHRAV